MKLSNKNKEVEQQYWDKFYIKYRLDVPSQFCVFVATDIAEDTVIVEFGCGNGRDSLYLANHGFQVIGFDLSSEAIQRCQHSVEEKKINSAKFVCGDMSNSTDVKAVIDNARERSTNQELVIYSRFVMHSIDDNQEEKFLSSLSSHLLSGERVFLEFRSQEDEKTAKLFGNHYRRYIDSDKITNSLESRFGFNIDYAITGQGMAKYKEEDPFVTRIIATKN